MSDRIAPFAEICAAIIEGLGVALLTLSVLVALGTALVLLGKRQSQSSIYAQTRERLGRALLLGLELLVAADIIQTVAVELTLERIVVLALVVLVRTFLSFTLEVELTGHWPWQQKPDVHKSP